MMGIPGEIIINMMGCNHREICRFSNESSSSYKAVLGVLREWTEDGNEGM